jgi:hypothetical protein
MAQVFAKQSIEREASRDRWLGSGPLYEVWIEPISLGLSSINGARYKEGNPNPRPQSLAKRMPLESNSQAGEELLQFPPVNCLSLPVAKSRSQIREGPFCADSNATNFPSGETTETLKSAGTGIARGIVSPVVGSNCIIVEVRFATNSK